MNLEDQIENLVSQHIDNGILLFIHEKGNVLEIVQVKSEGPPQILKSFEVDGPFEVLVNRPLLPSAGGVSQSPGQFSPQLYVYLGEKIQILDLGNLAKIKVMAELPFRGVSQIIPLGDFFYAVNGTSLNIIDSKIFSTRATIPIGTHFRILGEYRQGGQSSLVLALKVDGKKMWNRIQFMPLVADGSGVSDLGRTVDLKPEVEKIMIDQSRPYLYLLRSGMVHLFDLEKRLELQSTGAVPLQNIRFAQGINGAVYVASPSEMGRLEYRLQDLEKTEPGKKKKEPLKESKTPPLAAAPEGKKQPADFKWEVSKTVYLPSQISKIFLTGSDSVLLVNQRSQKEEGAPPLFVSKSFSEDTANLVPLKLTQEAKANLTLFKVTEQGVLAYDQISGKIFLIKKDLKSVQELKLAAQAIVGMDTVKDQAKYLYVATAQIEEKGETALVAYKMDSPKILKKVSSLNFEEIGGFKIFAGGQKALVACGSQGVCLVDVGNNRKKMALVTTIPLSQPGALALDVSVSPREKRAYVFLDVEGKSAIAIIDLTQEKPAEVAILPNLPLKRDQFKGLTYSYGGLRLLLPQDDGLAVYDVKDPQKAKLEFVWRLGKAFFADVTNRGQTVCVALGEKGVECGNFE